MLMMLLISQIPIVSDGRNGMFDVRVEMGALNCKLVSVSRTKLTVSASKVAAVY